MLVRPEQVMADYWTTMLDEYVSPDDIAECVESGYRVHNITPDMVTMAKCIEIYDIMELANAIAREVHWGGLSGDFVVMSDGKPSHRLTKYDACIAAATAAMRLRATVTITTDATGVLYSYDGSNHHFPAIK